MLPRTMLLLTLVAGLCLPTTRADEAAPLAALSTMRVKEVTVFKDGHALMLHEGRMPVDRSGDVLLDSLPAPVLGTFWPYSAEKGVKLTAVVAGQRRVLVERTSLSLRELLEGNVGAEVAVSEIPLSATATKPDGLTYTATIVGLPTRSTKELEATAPSREGERLPQKGNIILLKTADGVRVVAIDRIQQVVFRGPYKATAANEEFRNLLRLRLDWAGRQPAAQAHMGLMYLQKGIRWIPSYKFVLDGKGGVSIQLEATLVNELADLDDVTANLVIGVPNFAFADTADPIGLGQTVAQLSQHFQGDAKSRSALSNAIMSQVADFESRLVEQAQTASARRDLGPEISGSEKNEDLFIFTLRHVTLKKGQRMVVPVTSFDLKYQDVFTVDIGFAPPAEVWRQFNNHQQTEIARLLARPKAMHKIRLTNHSKYPITTAPAMIFKGDQLLGQGMATYTPIGGRLDLPITTAVDILVKKLDKETGREHNAANWEGNVYAKVNLYGTVHVTNHRTAPARIEVTRNVLGNVAEADHDGTVAMQNVFEDDSLAPAGAYPYWWAWYSWPYWWTHFNGVAKVTWTFDLDPGESIQLKYTWSYYWR
jgi:hypothetical protein